ncbi:MAG: T9SS type A sorting domain-containing protein, partial [Flavobacteriales bacterium]|nr:T9SS type A sorting domain-containing protein [Flavobacteriales bacterium]
NIPAGFFEFHLQELDSTKNVEYDDATWKLYFYGDTNTREFTSARSINVENEQLLLDVGLSITIKQIDETRSFMGYNGSTTGNSCTDEDPLYVNDFLDAWIDFEDQNQPWLTGVVDEEGASSRNWIRAGTTTDPNNPEVNDMLIDCFDGNNTVDRFIDPEGIYESVLGGTWAPFRLGSAGIHGPVPGGVRVGAGGDVTVLNYTSMQESNSLRYLNNVDVVFTSDKSKWTRCPVVEMQADFRLAEGNVQKGALRFSPSVDKEGIPFDTTGLGISKDSLHLIPSSTDPNAANYIGGYGMGWFPGYAIDVETGERLNMAFGEDSWMQGQNGRDMIWNPTDQIVEGPFNNTRLGGKHYIFIFRNNNVEDFPNTNDSEFEPLGPTELAQQGTHVSSAFRRMPMYDNGAFAFEKLQSPKIDIDNDPLTVTNRVREWQGPMSDVYRAATWVTLPLLAEGFTLNTVAEGIIPNEAKVGLRVSTPYRGYGAGPFSSVGESLQSEKWYYVDKGPIQYGNHVYQRGEYFWTPEVGTFSDASGNDDKIIDDEDNVELTINGGRPTYFFNTHDISTIKNDANTAVDALDLIGVVPNPYYAYSQYEESKLDNRIKIINLPKQAEINIYTTAGVLIRTITKDDPTITSVDWDLKNTANISIASGLYLIHVKVPDVGERVLKWYGMMRPLDLDNF